MVMVKDCKIVNKATLNVRFERSTSQIIQLTVISVS